MPAQLLRMALSKLSPAPAVMPEPLLDTIVQMDRERLRAMLGDGTDPNARTALDRPLHVGHTGFNPLMWVIVLIAALVALVYALDVAR